MKLLLKNKKYILSIFLTILMVFCTLISGYADITPVQDRTPQIRDAIVAAVPGVNSANDVTAAHLAAIATLEASKKSITALKVGDFDGLTALTTLDLSHNAITNMLGFENLTALTALEMSHNSISDISVLENLPKLRWLYLSHNSISNISPLTNLTALKNLGLGGNSISDISALEKLTALRMLWLSRNAIEDISVFEKLTGLKNLWLGGNSISDVSVLEGLTSLLSLNLSGNPISDLGPLRRLKAANPDITIDITIDENNNNAPVFTAGTSTTRSIAENTASGVNIGSPIAATDADTGDTLTYTLGGTDAASFRIVSTSGQLRTSAALDYETKSSYSVSVSVSDGNGGSDSIAVTINVTDVNENRAPAFNDGTSTTRSIAENTDSGTNIGSAIAATDADNHTLTYTLGGTDASSFRIVSTSGQLQTNTALNYESKSSYSVSVSVSDNNGGSDSIAVTINVTNVNEAPSFASTTATRSIAENTASGQNIGSALVATDVDANTTLTYTLGGTDASSFSIVSNSGQIRTSAALDRETKASYSVTVTASDGSLSDTIAVTINVTNVNEAPSFASSTATRSIAENTAANTNIGSALVATDVDGNTLTYSIPTTGDAAAFSIDSNTGQLKTKNALNYENDTSYTVVVTASDGSLTDTISVTISVTDVNEAPTFATGATISNISATNGTAITSVTLPEATDVDANTTLTYTVTPTLPAGLTFTPSTRILSGTPTAVSASTTYTYTASDSNLSDTLTFSIQVSAPANRAPTFTAGTSTTRSIAENTASGENIGSAVAATDADTGNTLAYTLSGTDASSFSIVSTSGQLQTSAALNYESKSSYSVTVGVSDGNGGSDSIAVTINVTNVNEAPSFASTTATRSVAENTASGQNIGSAVSATDVDANTTLTYTLGGDDAASFSIVSTSGQLQTSAALDYETKNSYSVTVTAADGTGEGSLSTSIPVTISVTDVNDAPVFTDGATTTRSIAENSVANTNIGTVVAATDQDKKPDPVNPGQLIAKDTITYSIPATGDAAAFSIDSSTGQLKTKDALNYENDTSYTVVVTASDGSLTDTITVTISVTNVNEAPAFATGASISNISATNGTAITSVTLPEATDPDANTTLTYTVTPTLPAGLTFTASTRILSGTPTAVSASTTYTYTASDSTLSDTLTFSIQVSAANSAPVFTDGTTTTRSVAENTASGQNIGTAVAATDANNDTLTYTLGGTDASSFSIVGTSGQLQTNTALNYESKSSYSVSVSVSDNNGGSDSIDVTINVTNVNEKPSFSTSGRVILSVAENTAANTNIGTAFQATDPDSGDTMTYSLQRGDKDAFSINANTGQLQTHTALDYETKNAYSDLAVRATDSGGLVNSVLVTVNVTNANEAPAFSAGTSINNISATAGTALTSVTLPEATDVDAGNTITYTVTPTLPAGLTFTASTRLLSGTPTTETASTTYTYTASDGTLSATLTFSIQVSAVPNNAPVFTDGTETTRAIAENTGAGQDIGTAVAATDADNDTLTYTLGGDDAASFSIVSTTGQLQTSAALDRETKASYSVTITADDGRTTNNTDSINVTISVTNVNEAPTFASNTATRSVAENTATNQNIGAAFTATDVDSGTTLTYSIPTTGDAAAFSIDSNTGQLKTKDALNYENDTSYTVVVTASDGSLTDTISVTISVTNVNEAPSFATGTTISNISATKGTAITSVTLPEATDPDANTTLTYTVTPTLPAGLTFTASTRVLAGTPTAVSDSATYTYTASDSNLSATLTFSIQVNAVPNNAPAFTDGTETTRSIAENTASGRGIGTAVSATDADNDTLAYTLGGTDASSFSIVSTSGQLQTSAALNYETKNSYSVTVDVSDSKGGTDSIDVTINVTDVNEFAPVFTDGTSTTRSIAENTASDENIGSPVAATDADTGNTLTYSLGGTDASSFSIVSTTGQLLTSAPLNYEVSRWTKNVYSVSVSVSDGNGRSDSITVTINVTDANDSPVFYDGRSTARWIVENTASGTNIGRVVSAGDEDGDTPSYTLGGTDASSFSIVSTSGQLQTNAALDYDTKSSYSVTVTASDGNGGSNSITVTINVMEVPDTISPPLSSRTPAVRDAIVSQVRGVSNADDVTPAHLVAITYLGLSSQSISSLKSSDFNGLSTLDNLNLNNNSISDLSPLANLTSLTSLQLSRNSISDLSPLANLTSLTHLYLERNSITDVSALENLTSLQWLRLKFNPIPLSAYGSLRRLIAAVAATHGRRLSLDVDPNKHPPVFTEGDSTTRAVAENTPPGIGIGAAVSATDADPDDRHGYYLGGPDAESFGIDRTTGWLRTKAALDYETKSSYSVTITVNDSSSGSDRINVTINVTDVNEAPTFSTGTTISNISATKGTAITSVTLPAATDPEGNTPTYTLSPALPAGLTFTPSTRRLAGRPTATSIKTTYTYRASDGTHSTDLTFTIDVQTPGNNNPVFTAGTSTTRTVAENTVSGTNLGSAIVATDANTGDTLTYTLGGTDASSFSIVSTSGQLQTSAALDYEAKTSYSVTVTVTDGNGGSDSIAVTINVTNVNEPPNPAISARTPAVKDAILAELYLDNPDDVTEDDLISITYLYVGYAEVTSLKTGDFNGLTEMTGLGLDNNSISDISVLEDLTSLTRLDLSNNSISDISVLEDLTSLTELSLNNNSISDISALENLTSLEYLYLSNNSITDVSALENLTALIWLEVSGNPIPDYGPLRRLKTATEAIEDHWGIAFDIDIDNNPPVFTAGDSTTRTVAENTTAGTNIGAAVAATDTDENDILTYTLGGTDADSFSIDSATGQLQTSAALDYETKTSYTVTVDVSDGNGLDRITVTINVTNVAGAAPPVLPGTTALLPNFPNPFNPETWIPYQLAEPAEVTLTIYDIQGRVVRTLRLGHQPAGVYRSRSRAAHWDGRNQLGEKVATGIYFYTLKAGDYMATRKLLIRK